MAIEIEPIPGEWYENIETHQIFRVIDIDETSSLIEIQYVDGDIGEMDMVAWEGSDLEWIEPPENWTTPYDDIEPDDLGYSDTDTHPEEEPKIIKRYGNEGE
ncbi:DUF6763 family protein [Nitrosococcus wardiae]|uniref:Uncharacterized protein n=1 Tax=Nitrosococcus wardiae TaxID=1814290 RepID=A0A4P7BZ56_9GAMM|nr:DUF6763 family protein [Nitrosococcus wardiae]QBQ54549.1 hypothetical protein E3U44_08530 [Nitrosococcus wardiae]